jgi:hypothetical protein
MQDHIQVSGTWNFIWHDKDGNELRRRTAKNLVVTTGLIAIAEILSNELAQDCAVFLALGTGTTAAAAGDTKLETESERKIITTRSRSSATLIYRTYYLVGEAVGDYTEWGLFFAATAAKDSGRLFNRVLPAGGVSKDSSEQLTVEVQIAFAAA